MADEEKGTSKPQPPKLGRVTRTAGFWLVLVMVSILTVQLTSRRAEPVRDIAYSEFKAELKKGNVDSVTVIDGVMVEGRVKQPWTRGTGEQLQRFHRFRTRAPVRDSEDMITALEAANVRISAREPAVGVGRLLLASLPWLLIIALWIFFMRQMQASGNKAFQFGKSKARMLSGDTPKVSFDDVA
ncbi:MAG TPA: ATP-dependent metallopeptidase FtsH/Yme1/Tma family protein, partial [Longimicrobium sp.]|nr:ATP-dependent metallopeptidase FtsH/Yme1/Tma family protein [Longimicrobium sp.]